jgi:3-oxoacyl-[acyl-carrier protein] reductase
MRVIRGKKALVTGAASGIGRAIALALARAGTDLYLVDIDEVKLAATLREAQSLGVTAAGGVCDLAQPAQISALINSVLSEWGKLDILVNNAGVAYYGATRDMTAEQWSRILAIDLLAPIQLVRELLPTLLARDEAHIVNVCSIFGLVPMRKGAAYQTCKFGLVGLSAALRAEYGREIGVTALCPGFVRTPMLETFETGDAGQRRHAIPAWLCARPEAIGAAAVRAIQRNQGLVVITPAARLLWWTARLSPGLLDWLTRQGWRGKKRKPAVPA